MRRRLATYPGFAVAAMLLLLVSVRAGDLTPVAPPNATNSATYTLNDIYDRLSAGTEVFKRTGAFSGPAAGPASSVHTLDEIMWLVDHRAPVAKTGQTNVVASGDDGTYVKGFTWPVPRFTDNGDGTVKDNLTGLIWLQRADAHRADDWQDAVQFCNSVSNGVYGLTDGSVAGDWRLPNVRELFSLVDFGHYEPALPADYADFFVGSPGDKSYWSSTTFMPDQGFKWQVSMWNGGIHHIVSTYSSYYAWPVRGGQSPSSYTVVAASLDAVAPHTASNSAMYSIGDVYDRLDTGASAVKRTTGFPSSPSEAEGSGHTLNDLMELVDRRAPVQKTGQTSSIMPRDDGDFEIGVASPTARFTFWAADTCVVDHLTGLMWTRDATVWEHQPWSQAVALCNGYTFAGFDDWRLPNVRELSSLFDYGQVSGDPLPTGHPFQSLTHSWIWWTSTTSVSNPDQGWAVIMNPSWSGEGSHVKQIPKSITYHVWPVRMGR